MIKIPQFLIAAPTSSAGKTTISTAIMKLLVQRGLRVQPFKCGPDYIDTKFHEKVCGRASFNLDSFFASPSHLKEVFSRFSSDVQAVVVEGMMGLYDGYSRSKGSAAEIAFILGLPIVLVVDAKSAAYSLTPMLKGFKEFSLDVKIAGVIFNRVGSARHETMLREVCQDVGLEPFGFIPKIAELETPSRYLGLDFSSDFSLPLEKVSENLDLDKLLTICTKELLPSNTEFVKDTSHKILVARNSESFSFIYAEHLAKWGNVEFFDPEEDAEIDQDIDLLYLPGGYPEKHLEKLSPCEKTVSSIRKYAENGGKILAECGGMIYLCSTILCDSSSTPLCGVFPYKISCKSTDKKLTLGYRRFSLGDVEICGHEFHYTQFTGAMPQSITQVYNAKGEEVSTPVFRTKNAIASYTHLYWGEEDIFKIF